MKGEVIVKEVKAQDEAAEVFSIKRYSFRYKYPTSFTDASTRTNHPPS
jgi:hypothetical protein